MYEKYNIKFQKVVPYIGTWIETKDVVVMMKTF